MDWGLTPDQQMIRDTVREFVVAEIEPNAPAWDREKRFPHEVFEQLGQLGLFGMVVPERWGGAGLDGIAYCLALEELARGDASTCVAISVTNSVYCAPILKYGTDEQRDRWLRPCAAGKWLGAFCLSEPEVGSDPASIRVRARRDGNGYVLSGTKAWITSGSVCGSMLVFAVTDPDAERERISAFVVPSDMDGVSVIHEEEKMGLRSSVTNQVAFDDCRLGPEHRLGAEGQGLNIALDSLDGGRAGIAAQATGIARASLEVARDYLGERDAFGRALGMFEGLRNQLARMAAEIRGARLLYLRAAHLHHQGRSNTRAASIAKLFASELANRAAYTAGQMHGGYGYVIDYPVERYYRDARVTTIYEGTSEIQRLVIARSLLK